MQLRSLYRQDPSARKLVNEGVANVNDGTSSLARDVLRYELETFVCDGCPSSYKVGRQSGLSIGGSGSFV